MPCTAVLTRTCPEETRLKKAAEERANQQHAEVKAKLEAQAKGAKALGEGEMMEMNPLLAKKNQ